MRLCPGRKTMVFQASRDFCCSESSPPNNPFTIDNCISLLRSFLLQRKSPEKSLLEEKKRKKHPYLLEQKHEPTAHHPALGMQSQHSSSSIQMRQSHQLPPRTSKRPRWGGSLQRVKALKYCLRKTFSFFPVG